MTVVLDTDSLIHFFTNDVPDRANQVKDLFDTQKNINIPEVVFVELEATLSGKYKAPRPKILTVFHFLASQKNIKLSNHIKKAIHIFENSDLGISDCIIAAYGVKGYIATHDTKLLQQEGATPFWK